MVCLIIGKYLIFYYKRHKIIFKTFEQHRKASTGMKFWTQKNIFHLFTIQANKQTSKQTNKQAKYKLFVLNWLIRIQSTSCSERRYRVNLKWLFGLKNENQIWREISRPTANKCRYPEWEKIFTKRSETKNWIFTMIIILILFQVLDFVFATCFLCQFINFTNIGFRNFLNKKHYKIGIQLSQSKQ